MRESLNISLTDSLRRANVRPRLDALAGSTGFAAAQVAGRALLLGLRAIEGDWSLLFPASDPPHPEAADTPPPRTTEPEHASTRDATPCDAQHRTDAECSTEPSTTAPAESLTLDAQPDPASAAATQPGAAPHADASAEEVPSLTAQPGQISTREAAHALGYRTEGAFRQHCQRHPELRRLAHKTGRALVWDLAELRAEYARLGMLLR